MTCLNAIFFLSLSLSLAFIFIALHGLTFTCLSPSKCLNWPLSRCEDGYKGFIRLQLGWHLGWRCTCRLNLCRRERVYATLPAFPPAQEFNPRFSAFGNLEPCLLGLAWGSCRQTCESSIHKLKLWGAGGLGRQVFVKRVYIAWKEDFLLLIFDGLFDGGNTETKAVLVIFQITAPYVFSKPFRPLAITAVLSMPLVPSSGLCNSTVPFGMGQSAVFGFGTSQSKPIIAYHPPSF